MKPNNILAAVFILILTASCAHEYHVSPDGDDQSKGSSGSPLRTISKAAEVARPGDLVTVHEGIYREQVNPLFGGTSDTKRIVYQAAEGEQVEVKGSEVVSGWESLGGGVWKAILPNSLFGDHNPFVTNIAGDWLVDGGWNHTGEVYLNGKSLYESQTLEGVMDPVANDRALDPDAALYTWYAECDDEQTTLWANFHSSDPNVELVEVHVRESCFYPDAPGRNYITVDGFHMSQAATQWAPPSAEQVGIIGTHWSKGWIIQNCTIHDSKCSGITLGKDRKSGHNGWEPGTSGADHYNRIVVKALDGSGWSKENIGGHLVSNNTIYNCEQTGICGSLGAINSVVSGNHIHHIWTKRLFFGYEIGAIKFHAPIDVLISNNRLHDAHKGLWMDWMTQGTRITGNLCYNNELADLFAEVNHGPYLVDNNIFLSGIHNWSEGGAYVHNLIAGEIILQKVLDRSTPFHDPHSTTILGLSNTTLGDDRFHNNLFVAPSDSISTDQWIGLNAYNQVDYEFPVHINHNVYYGGAVPFVGEEGLRICGSVPAELKLEEQDGGLYLHITLEQADPELLRPLINTAYLGTAVRTGQAWEYPDGSPMQIDSDYFGQKRKLENPSAGPFEDPGTGKLTLLVWKGN
jgi:hypothetical protein